MGVQLFGKVYQHNGYEVCSPATLFDTFSPSKPVKKKAMRRARADWDHYLFIKSCEVYATFSVNGYSFTKYLK